MSLYGILRTSASGMTAQADRLGAVSDNIANITTDGYKRADVQFSSFLLGTGGAEYQSGSVVSVTRHEIGRQGAFNYTSSPTDLAIDGNGFFVVAGSDGRPVLTRAGAFVKDGSGDLVNTAGFKLLGYPVGVSGVSNGYAGLVPVNISTLALQAKASDHGELYLNLPSGDAIATTLPSTNPTTPLSDSTHKTSLTVYDNLGAQVTLDVYTTKTAANTWEVAIFDAASAGSGATKPFPYASGPLAIAQLNFNPTSGKLVSSVPDPISVTIPNGAPFTLDMSQSSQLATGYTLLSSAANGNAPSEVTSVDVSPDGVLSAVYANGTRVAAFNIPLATVTSPDELTSLAGNVYAVSATSGDVQLGTPGAGAVGSIVASALEKSPVDLSTELTTMIQAQTNYTANSKVFSTAAQLLDVLVNIRG